MRPRATCFEAPVCSWRQPLSDESGLAEILSQKKPGDTVSRIVIRGGQQQDVSVTLGDAPQTPSP
jgi:S1-C subfamily serine protease